MTNSPTVCLFGVPKILVEGRADVQPPTRKGSLLLAMLATNRGRPLDRAALAYDLWGDLPEARARRNLNTEIWRLKGLLGDAIVSEAKTVGFSPTAPCRIDVAEFEAADETSEIEALEAALAVYRGEFLSGHYEDWVVVRREYYRDRYIHYLDLAARRYQAAAMPRKAIESVRTILRHNPLHEESHQRLMRLYWEVGDSAAAVRQYQECASLLDRELSLQPLPETQALYGWIRKRLQADDSLSSAPSLRAFVGREENLQALQKKWETLKPGVVESAIVVGESGIGKTRLVEHWLAGVAGRACILRGRCHEADQRVSHHPILEMLRSGIAQFGSGELSRLPASILREIHALLPELAPPQNAESKLLDASAYARQQTLYSLTRGLKAWAEDDRPLLLFLDDAQWADDETLDLLAMLGEDGDVPILLIATYRPEPLAPTDARRMDARIGKLGRSFISLDPLTRGETVELIRRMGRMSEPPREFGEWMYAETEGNPLFIIESLKGLFDSGHLSTNAEGAWTTSLERPLASFNRLPLAASLKEVIQKRFERLAPRQKDALRAASVIGREFDRDVLTAVSGMNGAELDEALPPLLRGGLIEETGTGGSYNFAHVKIRETIFASLEDGERKALHSKAARYFEGAPEHEGNYETLALHCFSAGELGRALEYYEKAGEREMALHAYKVAALHFESGEKLCAPAGMDDKRFSLLMKRYLCLWTVESDHDQLQEILEAAKQIAEQTRRPRQLAQASFYRGINFVSRGVWDEGEAELRRALEASIRAEMPEIEMRAHLELTNLHGHNLEYPDALGHAQAALKIAEELGDFNAAGRARREAAEFSETVAGQAEVSLKIVNEAMQRDAVDLIIHLGSSFVGSLYYAEDFGGALELGERILDYGRARGLLKVLGRSVQRVLARVYCEIGAYDRAADLAGDALRLSRLSGYRYGEMRSLACLGAAHKGMGRLDDALTELNRAATLCARINSKGDLLNIKLATAETLLQFADADRFRAAESVLGEIRAGDGESPSAEIEASALSLLAQICLAQGRLQEALDLSESAVRVLENDPRKVLLPAPLAYFSRAQALQAAGDAEYKKPLALARQSVHRRSVTLSPKLRRAFLRGVPLNREIFSTR